MDGSLFSRTPLQPNQPAQPDAYTHYVRVVTWAHHRYIHDSAFSALLQGRASAVRAYTRIEEAAFTKYIA